MMPSGRVVLPAECPWCGQTRFWVMTGEGEGMWWCPPARCVAGMRRRR